MNVAMNANFIITGTQKMEQSYYTSFYLLPKNAFNLVSVVAI